LLLEPSALCVAAGQLNLGACDVHPPILQTSCETRPVRLDEISRSWVIDGDVEVDLAPRSGDFQVDLSESFRVEAHVDGLSGPGSGQLHALTQLIQDWLMDPHTHLTFRGFNRSQWSGFGSQMEDSPRGLPVSAVGRIGISSLTCADLVRRASFVTAGGLI
jgi:hypothetical protein